MEVCYAFLRYRAGNKKEFYKVVKIKGKNKDILTIEYFVEKYMTR